jgi:tetratricopeptide (TPR) repeat protein
VLFRSKGYVHAIDFMVYAHLQMAQDGEAKRWVDNSIALLKTGSAMERSPTGAALTVHTAHAAIPARYAIERGAWEEAAALPVQNTAAVADAITHFARAMGFARLNSPARARTEIQRLEELEKELGAANQAYWVEQVAIQRIGATAWVLYAEGNRQEALRLMRSAADKEDASEKHVAMENRLWPLRELLAEMLMETGQPAAALKEFEISLGAARNRLRSLYGAGLASEKIGDTARARDFYRQLANLTSNGNRDRPEVRHAHAFIASR